MDNELITEVATIRINPDDVMPIDNISGLTRWLEDEYAVLTKTHCALWDGNRAKCSLNTDLSRPEVKP